MTELIITEKPSMALKVASALSDDVKKLSYKNVPYYELMRNKKKIIVACAVGHLYTLAEKSKKGWQYPVFDVEWKPVYEADKSAAHSKAYINTIKALAKKAESFTIATDYDVEGEVIGFNILRFICQKTDAKRMKFSTTTKEDLLYSYEHIMPHIDTLQAEAGLTRHELDYYYGINLSRALTLSIKNATGMFKILSSGRVQGPALKILAERERAIKAFKPTPFWRIELLTKDFSAWHITDKFWNKEEAEHILQKIKGKKAVVAEVLVKQFEQAPPHPFDLTALQVEAYKQFGISPKETMEIAQNLYVNSYISYPRTSSNQLPPAIGYAKIISKLAKMPQYATLCAELLKKNVLMPNNGKKKDPAHPAIYFTGEIPSELKEKEAKVFDLIVRRTLASFAEAAVRESMIVRIDVNNEPFVAKGVRTLKPGWHNFYAPYVKLEETELPKMQKGQELDVKEIKLHEKETEPPKRFTQASLVKELEAKNLGTKATRSEIIENLFKRAYVRNTAIEVTDLGMATVETLEKYCPEILDEALTRNFEEEMEMIIEKKKSGKEVLEEARHVLTDILKKFKEKEKEIGAELAKAMQETWKQETIVGKCACGGDLRIMYSKKSKKRFVACSRYPECKTTFSLPQGLPRPTGKLCPECNFPLVLIVRKGKRPFEYCINKQCPKKAEWAKKQEENRTS